MDRLWGEMRGVPEKNLRVLHGGETILDGAYEVAYTPGHASHHVSYRHDGTAFVGDVGGVRITEAGMTIPPTPPPDIDVGAWHESIALLRRWAPDRLAMTHFGAGEDPPAQLDELEGRLDEWSALAHDRDRDGFISAVGAEIRRHATPEQAVAYQQAAPVEQLYAGYERYWSQRG
jgi:glyoxylase-like metal-dependent hydrolase (beta-lactamase superfamily II)